MKLMTRPASFPARKSTSSNLLMTSSQVSLSSRPKVKNSASGFKVCSCSSFICAVVERGGVELGDDEAVKEARERLREMDTDKDSKIAILNAFNSLADSRSVSVGAGGMMWPA